MKKLWYIYTMEYWVKIKNKKILVSFIVAPIAPRTKSSGRVEVGEGSGTGWGRVEGWG